MSGREASIGRLEGPLVETAWLESVLGSPDLRVLDCTVVFERRNGELHVASGRDRWEEGHIPTSQHVDLLNDLADPESDLRYMMPPEERFATAMEAAAVGRGTKLVLYDSDQNMWATRVWWMLRAFGFEDAVVLNGGWRKWSAEGREVSLDASPSFPAARFEASGRRGYLIGKQEVLAAIDDDEVCIVNSLSAAQHRGETNDYARPGHIPGAVNVPAADLVDPETHVYHDLDRLRELMAPVMDSESSRAITYCGGGISATSDAFVLALLGHQHVAIYDGSMSEWAPDLSMPLEV